MIMDFEDCDDYIEVDDRLELSGEFTISINLTAENLECEL